MSLSVTGLRATHHHPDLQVILQIVADARRIEHDIDAVLFATAPRGRRRKAAAIAASYRPRPRSEFPCAPAPFAALPALRYSTRDSATSLEQDALRQRGSLDMQIAAVLGGAKIGDRRARASAAAASWSGKIRRLPASRR